MLHLINIRLFNRGMMVAVFNSQVGILNLPKTGGRRYVRVVLQKERPNPPLEQRDPRTQPKAVIPHRYSITTNSTADRKAPVGRCIYCGAEEYRPGTGAPLHEEHVIAEGLGGTLILPEASCAKCEVETGRTEQNILKGMLLASRRQMKLRKKHRARHEPSYALVTVVNGKDVEIRLPLGDHPAIIFFSSFHPPRLVKWRSRDETNLGGMWVHVLGHPPPAYERGEGIASPGFDTLSFAQMLAKIAHSYAVAVLGLDGFRPYLTDFIRQRFGKTDTYHRCFDWVGGDVRFLAPDDDLHAIGLTTAIYDGRRCAIVAVRLFANLAAPLYWVVVGEISANAI